MYSLEKKISYKLAIPMRFELARILRQGLAGSHHTLPSTLPLQDQTPQSLAAADATVLERTVKHFIHAFRYFAAWLDAHEDQLLERQHELAVYYQQLL